MPHTDPVARREYMREYRRHWLKTPAGIAYNRAKRKRFYDRNQPRHAPERNRAYAEVQRALKDGRLTRQPCNRCGDLRSHAHHHRGYEARLDVQWLCATHHKEAHR